MARRRRGPKKQASLARKKVPKLYDITISKINGDWTVSRPFAKVSRGGQDQIRWNLLAGNGVSAHLQFCDGTLFSGHSLHWTASIGPVGGTIPTSLTLTVHGNAAERTHHYAVWVCDPALPEAGVYAIGHNPPPEIDIGP